MASIVVGKVSNGITLTYHRMDDTYEENFVNQVFQDLVNELHQGETFEWVLEDVDTWVQEIEVNGRNIHADVAIVDGSVQYG